MGPVISWPSVVSVFVISSASASILRACFISLLPADVRVRPWARFLMHSLLPV